MKKKSKLYVVVVLLISILIFGVSQVFAETAGVSISQPGTNVILPAQSEVIDIDVDQDAEIPSIPPTQVFLPMILKNYGTPSILTGSITDKGVPVVNTQVTLRYYNG